ncbi:hypothetical protein AG1IA_10371 [Rhizoctonia solani AG-1 IA]|uniref:Uncharacterized protein n=1 Tax=Thanatephorus cucumeris (strain AG1-IA) TaxID=983506 RepID=L8WGS8_THACA|nr:hypothetical protein AG1IA_10371 [Rhizoctonia solani AG-1 IA]
MHPPSQPPKVSLISHNPVVYSDLYTQFQYRDTTIALMFEPPRSRQLFKNQFPVVWKVLTFPVKNRSGSSIQYLPRFAFAYGQVVSPQTPSH